MYTTLRYCFASRVLTLCIVICLLACAPIPQIADTGGGSSSHTTVLLPARPKSNVVTIEWMSPSPAENNIPEIGGKIEIKIRITSANPINQDEIDIYINGVLLGNKAGEVSLMRRPDFKDNILIMQVPLTTGANAIQAVVTKGAEQRFFAERTFIKDSSGIRVKPTTTGGLSTITWVDPDLIMLRGEMFSTKNKDLAVRFNINCPENIKMENIKIFINKKGFAPKASATLVGEKGNFIFKDVVSLDESVDINEIHLRVETIYGSFESESLKINYAPIRPNIYLLSIGARLNLKYAYKDARDFAMLYSRQHRNTYRLFNSVNIDTLIGAAATTSEIRGLIETTKTKLKTGQILEDDLILLFISSHGFMDEKGDFRIQGSDYTPERRTSTSVSYKFDILEQLEELPCKKIVLIDACHSGGARANATDILTAIHDIKNAPRGFAILTSSSKDEESYEDVKWQNGAFTEGIIKGLKEGLADMNKNGIITLLELETYLKKVVPEMVNLVKSKPQHPLLSRNDIGDLPIFTVN